VRASIPPMITSRHITDEHTMAAKKLANIHPNELSFAIAGDLT
jgi:hypothetical protein